MKENSSQSKRSWSSKSVISRILHLYNVTLSQILVMNFGSFTTRGHSPITWTFTPHSYRSLIDCISHHPLHQHSCSQWLRLHLFSISQSPSHTHTHTHYISPGLSPTHCRVLLAQLPTKRFPVSRVRFPVSWFLHVLLDYSLCPALWIKFADRRPTLA